MTRCVALDSDLEFEAKGCEFFLVLFVLLLVLAA
jgi:hypothetical protein